MIENLRVEIAAQLKIAARIDPDDQVSRSRIKFTSSLSLSQDRQ